MTGKIRKRAVMVALIMAVAFATLLSPMPRTDAADHGDAPTVSLDKSTDIADVFAFLDPNDNSRVIILGTLQGFINPGEALNFGAFDHNVRYLFDIETTGDPRADLFFDVRFAPRTTSAGQAQTATVIAPFGEVITGPTTPGTFTGTSPTPVITTHDPTGIRFFAGLVDDPFFFDIPAFARFTASVTGGAPDPTLLQRGRDSFAGFNTLGIALSIPVQYLKLQGATELGIAFRTQRRMRQILGSDTKITGRGPFVTADRMATPAVNVALIPFPRKDLYNSGTPLEDANGRFANTIVGTLRALGTNDENINLLAQIAVLRGDFLRLSLTTANSGPGGGNNPGAGFPNGRRLQDDVIDIEIAVITNGAITTGDNANSNDRTFSDTFPFFGPTHTPLPPGTTDDRTRH